MIGKMRIDVSFSCRDLILPLSYHYMIQGTLYRILESSPEVSGALHDVGNVSGKKKYKLFVFKQLAGRYRIEGRNIVFPNGFTLEFRSADERIAEIVSDFCETGRELELNGKTVTVAEKKVYRNTPVEAGEIRGELLTVHHTDREGHTIYYSPDDPEFCAAVSENARRKWESTGSDTPFDFAIRTVPGARYRRTVTVFKGTYITAWSGRFLVQGNAELLSFLYSTGLGDRNSQGFGAFDPV